MLKNFILISILFVLNSIGQRDVRFKELTLLSQIKYTYSLDLFVRTSRINNKRALFYEIPFLTFSYLSTMNWAFVTINHSSFCVGKSLFINLKNNYILIIFIHFLRLLGHLKSFQRFFWYSSTVIIVSLYLSQVVWVVCYRWGT